MSNSKYVEYTKISPHRTSPRNHKIDKITIHHMAGNLSIETCGSVFQSRRASSNYGIGTDGRVGMYVEEKDRSWASSNAANDHRAVTIEVANSKTGGDWLVSDKALAKLIDLCVDICQRNDIKELNYTGNKNGNLTMHSYFAATACPGPYLKSKFPYIAAEVNKRLGTMEEEAPKVEPEVETKPVYNGSVIYRVQVGAYEVKKNAEAVLAKIKAAGFDALVVQVGNLYKVQVGAFSVKANADALLAKLKKAGFDGFITTAENKVSVAKKSVVEIAKEVIAGKWGVGSDRKKRLTAAGYDYSAVQKEVNRLLK